MQSSERESQNNRLDSSIIKHEDLPLEVTRSCIVSTDNTLAFYDDNDVIEFGPIKVKPRKKPTPTLATGRRSKYEILGAEEEQKRDGRRIRNRVAAQRVRLNRLKVEEQLKSQINVLEEQVGELLKEREMLENYKIEFVVRQRKQRSMSSTKHN